MKIFIMSLLTAVLAVAASARQSSPLSDFTPTVRMDQLADADIGDYDIAAIGGASGTILTVPVWTAWNVGSMYWVFAYSVLVVAGIGFCLIHDHSVRVLPENRGNVARKGEWKGRGGALDISETHPPNKIAA